MDDLECGKNENRPTTTETGNAAAMRETLEWILGFGYVVDGEFRFPDTNMVKQQVDAALAAPARNCDVGTADEQAERFEAECMRYDHCVQCPIYAAWGEFRKGKPKSCQLIWAQMPFAQTKEEVK